MKPTKSEQEWFEASREHGCLISNADCGGGIQSDHITAGGRRMGHHYTIPLCKNHHHWDSPLQIGDAFGKGKKPWEARHGKRIDLWRELRIKLGFDIFD